MRPDPPPNPILNSPYLKNIDLTIKCGSFNQQTVVKNTALGTVKSSALGLKDPYVCFKYNNQVFQTDTVDFDSTRGESPLDFNEKFFLRDI